ncbi:MAG TPA: SCP2 sterol-binding domain-containing protein [Methanomassiliicoccales archaeon]|nr:SCP2 sterol-binding domain-containing protein [Methanomassiliicoccales archaeon]
MTTKEHLLNAIAKFNDQMQSDAQLREEIGSLRKCVNIDLGTEHYSFVLEDGRISQLEEGLLESPDIVVRSDPRTIDDLFTGKMKPMKAWALRKVVIKGSLEDVMKLRKFF